MTLSHINPPALPSAHLSSQPDLARPRPSLPNMTPALGNKSITSVPLADAAAVVLNPTALASVGQGKNMALEQGLYEYAEARDFRFELFTREGDKVTIRASSSLGVSARLGATAGGDGTSHYLQADSSSASAFSLTIEGDLSEGELGAINELFGRVDQLANQFYAGNLDQVFDKALALGYDDQQIASYSLNLAQVQIQQVALAYGAFTPEEGGEAAPSLAVQLAPVGNFIKDVLESLGLASGFLEPHKLLLGLSQKMADKAAGEAPAPTALSEFLARILATDLAAPEAQPSGAAPTSVVPNSAAEL